MHRVVVVGGGAGGLELVTRLGNWQGGWRQEKEMRITLVDRQATHLWKPLLHEVAAGTLDTTIHALDYAAQAHWHGFEFCQGAFSALDRSSRTICVDAVIDADGQQLFPARKLSYDTLVIAVGSVTNFFDVPGAREHTFALDTVQDADRFRRAFIAACAQAEHADSTNEHRCVKIAIVGGGATGVELAAQLRQTAHVLAVYGLHKLDPVKDVAITVVEAAPRILSTLPERVSKAATELLANYGIEVACGEQVAEVTEGALRTRTGNVIDADVMVWAAGIKAPAFLGGLDHLTVGRLGQLLVRPTLQTKSDDDIFAMGDCAQCLWQSPNTWVPPRAQAAHQEASFLLRSIQQRLRADASASLPVFHYKDFGSLVSLGKVGATGSLMGGLIGGRIFVDGIVAKIMYVSLYRLHTIALHGWWRTMMEMVSSLLHRTLSPKVKLH
ncbi:NAD(P)/FAD-dependent oxidoreductase [Dyella sp. 2HG41-7]|uniref:NAD(P)/FAD-dependent oxidoreductase n=1 Tax=Dyella sp. 2HG41-7 TaxID=2883239 RepID=UPI001F2FC101|nr:NAD(P)/FAD-dependent oxidoreductase [Dyella sp. 2HG41-7]